MDGLFYLIPIALVIGLGALAAFMWALRSGQYEDLEGAGQRVLGDDDRPLVGDLPVPTGSLANKERTAGR